MNFLRACATDLLYIQMSYLSHFNLELFLCTVLNSVIHSSLAHDIQANSSTTTDRNFSSQYFIKEI